jgi:transcriptional regulator of acetoin/glycerol metabolism
LQHCAETVASRKGEWIESLRQAGIMPQMIIVGEVRECEGPTSEAKLIAKHRSDLLMNAGSDQTPNGPTCFAALEIELEAHRRTAIVAQLERCDWNIRETSRRLGMSRQTLYDHIKRMGLVRP